MVCEIHASSGVLDISADQYFVERDGNAFREFFASTLKLGQLIFEDDILAVLNDDGATEGLGRTTSHKAVEVRLITRPDVSAWVPHAIRSKVGHASEIEFHDDIVYDGRRMERPPYGLTILTRSPFLGEKRFRLQSRMEITPTPDGQRCIHTYKGQVHVHLLGFGGLVERMVRDSVEQTYRKLPDLIRKWNVKRQEILDAHGGDTSVLLKGRPHCIDCGVDWICEYPATLRRYEVPETRQTQEAVEVALTMHEKGAPWHTKMLFSVWIAIVELCKMAFIVFVVVLLRLKLVRMTPSRGHGSEVRHSRRNSWANVIPTHKRSASESSTDMSMADVDKILKRAHVRRQSSLSSGEALKCTRGS